MLKHKKRNSKRWNFGFQISQFFLTKKNHSFAEFFDKISDLYNKITQKLYNFFLQTIDK